jgi:hypothetical protein
MRTQPLVVAAEPGDVLLAAGVEASIGVAREALLDLRLDASVDKHDGSFRAQLADDAWAVCEASLSATSRHSKAYAAHVR